MQFMMLLYTKNRHQFIRIKRLNLFCFQTKGKYNNDKREETNIYSNPIIYMIHFAPGRKPIAD